MRARGAARAAAQSDFLATFHLLSFLYFELGEMQVQSQQTLAVIEYDEISLEIERPRQEHSAVIHGGDGSSAGDAEIQTLVWARGFAVEDALGTEYVGDGRVGGGHLRQKTLVKGVHLRLQDEPGVAASSEGAEPNRYVVVHPE